VGHPAFVRVSRCSGFKPENATRLRVAFSA
jgi:hypothetical protein